MTARPPALPSDGEPVSEFLRNLATTMRRTGQGTMARCVDEAASAIEDLSARATTLDKNCRYLSEKRDLWRQRAHSNGLENKRLAAERERLLGFCNRYIDLYNDAAFSGTPDQSHIDDLFNDIATAVVPALAADAGEKGDG